MRSKEDAHDYRYFPDPDLLPLVLDEDWIAALKARAAGTAGREAGAVHAGLRPDAPMTPACWSPNRRPRISTRPWRKGRDAEARRQLGHGRFLRRAEPHRPDDRGPAGDRGAAWRLARPDGATTRSTAASPRTCSRRWWRPARTRRRSSMRRACGRSPTPARSMPPWTRSWRPMPDKVAEYRVRQGQAVRLLRRPGDEGDGGQGQSGAGQRDAEAGTLLTEPGDLDRRPR